MSGYSNSTIVLNLVMILAILYITAPQLTAKEWGKTVDWRKINAQKSTEEFDKLADYLKESQKWETTDRIAYLEKTFNASLYHKIDSSIFFYGEKLGVLYREVDSIRQSLNILNIALKHSLNPSSKRISYNSLGGLHKKSGDFNTALDYYFKSLDEAKKLNDGSEAYPIGNISEIYSILGDYENAIKYLKYSIRYSSKLKNPEKAYSLVYDYSYIVSCYKEINQIDSAKYYANQILENIKFIDNNSDQKYRNACFIGYFYIAEFHLTTKESKQASYYIDKTEEFAHQFYKSSVMALRARHQVLNGNYYSAIRILESKILEEEYSGKEEILSLKADCYEALGEYQKSIDAKDQIIIYQSEKFGADRLKFSTFANVKYETFQKNEEIKSLRLDQKVNTLTIQNQRYIVFLTIALLSLLAFGLISFWRKARNRKKRSTYLQEQVDLKTKNLRLANEELRILSYVASHDLKEPIRNIGNFVGLIKRKIPDNLASDLNVYFDTIKKGTNQLYTLVEDISKFVSLSKDVSVETADVNMNELVNNLFTTMDQQVKTKKGNVHSDQLPIMDTNATIMFVILKNLIDNGLKFNQSETPIVNISHQLKNDHHNIIVSDNGIGIDQQFKDQIFESFKRLHHRGQYEGSGIGLSIVKVLLEKLNGKLIVESELDKGSQFIVQLPI